MTWPVATERRSSQGGIATLENTWMITGMDMVSIPGRIRTWYGVTHTELHILYVSFVLPSSQFEGQWVTGEQNGDGTYYYANGDVFKGVWKNSKKHGNGMFTSGNKSYEEVWDMGARVSRTECKFVPQRLMGTKKEDVLIEERNCLIDEVSSWPHWFCTHSCLASFVVRVCVPPPPPPPHPNPPSPLAFLFGALLAQKFSSSAKLINAHFFRSTAFDLDLKPCKHAVRQVVLP